MKLSVIVPVYNAESYLTRCIDSLLKQNLEEYEIVAVNDGSKDKSLSILREYVKKYPNIVRIIDQQNSGVSVARNNGMLAARGEYITFLDSDDYIEENVYPVIMERIKEGYDIVMYDYCRDYGTHKDFVHVLEDGKARVVDKHEYILSLPGTWNKVMKKELFIKNNLFFPVEKWYEDLAIIPQLMKFTDKIYYEPLHVVNYYQSDNSITRHDEFKQNSVTIFDAMNCLYKAFKDSAYKEELEYLYFYHLLLESSLYFYRHEKYQYIDQASNVMMERFPNWKQNKYVQKESRKNKFRASIFYKKKYGLLKFLQKIKHFIGR